MMGWGLIRSSVNDGTLRNRSQAEVSYEAGNQYLQTASAQATFQSSAFGRLSAGSFALDSVMYHVAVATVQHATETGWYEA